MSHLVQIPVAVLLDLLENMDMETLINVSQVNERLRGVVESILRNRYTMSSLWIFFDIRPIYNRPRIDETLVDCIWIRTIELSYDFISFFGFEIRKVRFNAINMEESESRRLLIQIFNNCVNLEEITLQAFNQPAVLFEHIPHLLRLTLIGCRFNAETIMKFIHSAENTIIYN